MHYRLMRSVQLVFRSDFSFLVCTNSSGSEMSFVGCQHLLISMGTFGDNTGIVSWIRLLKVDLHMQKSVSQCLWSNSERKSTDNNQQLQILTSART